MSVPIVIEKVLRASLQCFQRGGIIPGGADIRKIEQIPNNASDSDISDVLDSISFVTGGGVTTDSLSSVGDVNVFVDSDDDDSPATQPRYFRVTQDQATTPVTDQDHELLTIGAEAAGLLTQAPTLTVGPRLSLIASDKEAFVNIGANFDLVGGSHHFGVLHGASDAVTSGTGGPNTSGLTILSESNIGLSSANSIRISDENKNAIKSGWYDLGSSATAFHVGDWTVPDSFAIDPVVVSGKYYYNLHTTSDSGAIPCIHLFNTNATYRSQIIIGGPYGPTWTNPNNYDNPTLLVSGDDSNNTSPVAYLLDRKTGRTGGSEVFTIRSDSGDRDVPVDYWITRWYVGTDPVARISDGGDMSIYGAYSTGAGDVAELVETDQDYEPGTVLVLRDGLCVASDDYAQSSVVGVVSTRPGVLLGEQTICDDENEFELDVLFCDQNRVEVEGDVTNRLNGYVRHGRHLVKIKETRVIATSSFAAITVIHLEEEIELKETASLFGGVAMPPHVAKLGLCGKMPVWCSTEGGAIDGNGEILVSSPGGCAVVSTDPKSGTIIGKAAGKLTQPGNSVVKGTVEVLVNLQ